ncbi:MAG: hypothetical protein B1H03_04840 [Planctomycetales bacterium 4484_113]|nr:MAG: hypothetical protein B1H03_04840 [Planctomycetales bacterium 4484_113]
MLSILALALSCQYAAGQEPRIQGKVLDAKSGQPLPHIQVSIARWENLRGLQPDATIKPEKSTLTDNFGQFSFHLSRNQGPIGRILVFTADELYENQAYPSTTFNGRFPTLREIQRDASAVNAASAPEVTFLLDLAVRIEDPVMVPMRDGTELAATIYLPKEKGKYPTILLRTPYGRKSLREYAWLAREGYAVVAQDVRGRGDSGGDNLPFVADGWGKLQDGYDTVEWIAQQGFSDGKVGTAGGSALGIVQNLMAGAAPPHLKAQIIVVAATSIYGDAAYPGGILRKSQVQAWTKKNKFAPETQEVVHGHPLYDDYWKQLDLAQRIEVVDVPALYIGGWYDTFAEGTIEGYLLRRSKAGPKARGNTFLVMGPWTHSGVFSDRVGELQFPPPAKRDLLPEMLAFADYYLKGEGDFAEKCPPVQYYVMGDLTDPQAPGNFWALAKEFPPPAEKAVLFIGSEGAFSAELPPDAEHFVGFTFDPADPVPTTGGRNLSIPAGPADQRPVEERQDVIVFTTDTVKQPLPIVGLVKAILKVRTNGKDADVSVRLTDVYPDGTSFLLLDASGRLSMRPPYTKKTPVSSGVVYPLEVKLGHIAYIVNAGHRLRLALAGSNYPRFALNAEASPDGEPVKIQVSVGRENPSYLELPVYQELLKAQPTPRSSTDEQK